MSNTLTGLSQSEAEQRFQRYGPNRLPKAVHRGYWKYFYASLKAHLFMYCLSLQLWVQLLLVALLLIVVDEVHKLWRNSKYSYPY